MPFEPELVCALAPSSYLSSVRVRAVSVAGRGHGPMV
jgi:hypothetical protein